LNRVIDFAHENRLTRHQQVMFALADMMAHVEVADSMARLAAKEADATTLATARVFANTCARLVAEKSRTIVLGPAVSVPALPMSFWYPWTCRHLNAATGA
jgi:alkylation response protein AidB-like acyl-CoA dehydrogenase